MTKLVLKYYFFSLLVFFLVSCKIREIAKEMPDTTGYNKVEPTVVRHNDSLFSYKTNYLLKNGYNQWELYIEGDALERGIIAGALMDSLIAYQEDAFVGKINEMIPSKKKQENLLGFVSWFNRKIYQFIPNEYKVELLGLSKYMSKKYNFIGPPYLRNLYYHAAHDIGHALVDLAKVRCTSAALWGGRTKDGKLIVGRNLDFYMSDDFSRNKLILFVKPKIGIPFVSVAWPGMMGVVSGMNKAGLTITLNAGKSKIPFTAKEPISILARDIIQHASNIEEAIAIASKSEVFVSEALLVSSAKDNKAVVIEVSPRNFGVYEVNQKNKVVCSNHFQSDAYKKDKRNKERKTMGHSAYRFKRMNELINEAGEMTPQKMVKILRNKKGLNDKTIGYGNEKAINQLLCHHGVVFKPDKKIIWVSSAPYNEGAFTAYDLDEVFNETQPFELKSHHIDSLTIPLDSFIYSKQYLHYEKYRKLDIQIGIWLKSDTAHIDFDVVEKYRKLNPEFWYVHYNAGKLYYKKGLYDKAKSSFEKALSKEVTTAYDEENIKKILKKTKRKLK